MEYLIYTITVIGVAISIWGSQTNGTMSQNLATLGGLIWLAGIIWSFFSLGVKKGFILLIVSFIVGALLSRLFPKTR